MSPGVGMPITKVGQEKWKQYPSWRKATQKLRGGGTVSNGTIRLGGIGRTSRLPELGDQPINGGPQMVEISRDGRRVYLTNSLYRTWDDQFYPEGIRGWLAKIDVDEQGSMALDPRCFVRMDGMRPHQVRLEGGDASSDSYCFSGEK